MQHVDEGLLHALLDGELSALGGAREAEVRRHLAGCAECRARLEEARGIHERADALLRGGDPVGVEVPPFEALAARRVPARGPWRGTALAWAASVVLALGAGWLARSALQAPETAAEPRMRTAAPERAAPPPVASAAPESTPPAETARGPEPEPEATPRARVAVREKESAPVRDAGGSVEVEKPAPPAAPPPALRAEPTVSERLAPSAPAVPAGAPAPVAADVSGEAAPPGRLAQREERASSLALAREAETARRRRATPAPPVLELEGLVVTAAGTAGDTLEAADVDGWVGVHPREARRRLGQDPLRVPGLRVVSIQAGELEGRQAIRLRQTLGTDVVLSLVQVRGPAEVEGLPAESAPGEHARLVRRVGDVTVVGSAPLPADSLARLLERLR